MTETSFGTYYAHIETVNDKGTGVNWKTKVPLTLDERAAKYRRIEIAIATAAAESNNLFARSVYQLGDVGYTNGHAIRDGIIPCENNPHRGTLSRTVEQFHGEAVLTTGSARPVTHCCTSCAAKWHKHQEQRQGIRWA